jgi:hypothetical protein
VPVSCHYTDSIAGNAIDSEDGMANRNWQVGVLALVAISLLAGCLPKAKAPTTQRQEITEEIGGTVPSGGTTTPSGGTVAPSGTAALSWSAPTAYTDGTALSSSDLTGYRIYHGTSATSLTRIAEVDSRASAFTVNGLVAGTHHFAVTAVSLTGVESDYSSVGTKTIL